MTPIQVASRGMSTATAEVLGASGSWGRVGITIQKSSVSAKSRGLYADYSHELRQDMMAVHGEDVDSILADVMVLRLVRDQPRNDPPHERVCWRQVRTLDQRLGCWERKYRVRWKPTKLLPLW